MSRRFHESNISPWVHGLALMGDAKRCTTPPDRHERSGSGFCLFRAFACFLSQCLPYRRRKNLPVDAVLLRKRWPINTKEARGLSAFLPVLAKDVGRQSSSSHFYLAYGCGDDDYRIGLPSFMRVLWHNNGMDASSGHSVPFSLFFKSHRVEATTALSILPNPNVVGFYSLLKT